MTHKVTCKKMSDLTVEIIKGLGAIKVPTTKSVKGMKSNASKTDHTPAIIVIVISVTCLLIMLFN